MERPTETDPVAAAAALFEQGFTCGQAVLAAFADRRGLDRDAALRVACAHGGGIARTGSTCGAVRAKDGLFRTRCPLFVRSAARIVASLG